MDIINRNKDAYIKNVEKLHRNKNRYPESMKQKGLRYYIKDLDKYKD